MPLPEKALIARIQNMAGHGRLSLGIGDDTAILRLPPGHEALVTTDLSLEDVHFRRDWHPPDSVGHRCLARGLSDIAAMGGQPIAAFLSLALPVKLPQSWVDGFIRGLLKLARRHKVTLAGGDTAASPSGVMADIIVLGSAPAGNAIRRSGARPGDAIFVTGKLGSAAAALEKLYANPTKRLDLRKYSRHFYPEPRLEVGRWLARQGVASAMIDLSDGLSTDLHHICEESGVGAWIDAERLPREQGTSLDQALNGGEDYELCFTAPKSRKIRSKIASVLVTQIGEITRSREVLLLENGKKRKLERRGWQHFGL